MDKLKRRVSTLRLGDPMDKNTDIGAINSAAQLARIRELADSGVDEGATRWSPPTASCPGTGFWYAPTIFTDVAQSHRIAREEIFGPVLSVLTFRTHLTTRAAQRLTGAMPAAWGVGPDGTTGPGAGTGPGAAVLNAVARLAEIPGLSPDLARTIIAETGLDMTRFPTAAHLVSWAGLCPSARQSGPRTRPGKKGQGDTWLRGALGQAAVGASAPLPWASATPAYPHRRGKAKAQVAVARSILIIIWHLLANPEARFTDLGYGLLPGPHRQGQEDQEPHPADRSPARPPHHHH